MISTCSGTGAVLLEVRSLERGLWWFMTIAPLLYFSISITTNFKFWDVFFQENRKYNLPIINHLRMFSCAASPNYPCSETVWFRTSAAIICFACPKFGCIFWSNMTWHVCVCFVSVWVIPRFPPNSLSFCCLGEVAGMAYLILKHHHSLSLSLISIKPIQTLHIYICI